MPDMTYATDNRPKHDGWVKINGEKFLTVVSGGRQRFRPNRVVCHILDKVSEGKRCDLNDIWGLVGLGAFSKEEMHEFYRLIGYDINGYEEIFSNDKIESSED